MTDRSIADAAVAALGERAAAGQPFFGFVFFVSPHSPYVPHYLDMPGRTHLETYHQELRYMDEQVGRVLDALDALALSKRTIVIYAGDHGEEFREHGGAHHRATVYTESINVPLLVRIPGLVGRTIKEPTSVGYVLPWLLLHGTPAMKAAAGARMRTQFGPMLEHTGGAVVSEVLGHDRMKSTLIYDDLKLNYDYRAQRTEVYRTRADRLEHNDLFLKDPPLAMEATKRLAAYRDVRAARRRFKLRPDKLDPRRSADARTP
jgi:arylsulfatase A-like enzyme